jgi:hypothetical protein
LRNSAHVRNSEPRNDLTPIMLGWYLGRKVRK